MSEVNRFLEAIHTSYRGKDTKLIREHIIMRLAQIFFLSQEEARKLYEDYYSKKNLKGKSKHSRTKCMKCGKLPEVEVLWAEGKAHAWFCTKHYKEWEKKEAFKLNGKPVTFKEIVNKVRRIKGEASKKWNEPIKGKKEK